MSSEDSTAQAVDNADATETIEAAPEEEEAVEDDDFDDFDEFAEGAEHDDDAFGDFDEAQDDGFDDERVQPLLETASIKPTPAYQPVSVPFLQEVLCECYVKTIAYDLTSSAFSTLMHSTIHKISKKPYGHTLQTSCQVQGQKRTMSQSTCQRSTQLS